MRRVLLVPALFLADGSFASQGDFLEREEARAFIEGLVTEHQLDRDELEATLADAEHEESVIKAISRPAERRLEWHEYREIFLQPMRVRRGVAFWKDNRDVLDRAESQYGVAPEVIVAIIGVETDYGRVTGNYRALDALATLGFDYPPRAEFFLKELRHFLVLASEEGRAAGDFKSSYAGALGLAQFMPSSYRAFAVDFSGDGQRDIWSSPEDAIGSVANYLSEHGWQPDGAVILPVTLGEDIDLEPMRFLGDFAEAPNIVELKLQGVLFEDPGWQEIDSQASVMLTSFDHGSGAEPYAGLNNFYVITRYNRSHLYALAVHELSQMLLQDF